MRPLMLVALLLTGCSQSPEDAARDECIAEADALLELRERNARRSEPNQQEYDEAVDRFFEEYEADLADCHARF